MASPHDGNGAAWFSGISMTTIGVIGLLFTKKRNWDDYLAKLHEIDRETIERLEKIIGERNAQNEKQAVEITTLLGQVSKLTSDLRKTRTALNKAVRALNAERKINADAAKQREDFARLKRDYDELAAITRREINESSGGEYAKVLGAQDTSGQVQPC